MGSRRLDMFRESPSPDHLDLLVGSQTSHYRICVLFCSKPSDTDFPAPISADSASGHVRIGTQVQWAEVLISVASLFIRTE